MASENPDPVIETKLPGTVSKGIINWLILCCLLVFVMVVIGGITRLTHSGLSMVDWKPVTGIFPPTSESDWEEEFRKYKLSPEFKKINYDFSLDEYQSIYWWEYLHRMLGRFIGLVFIVPFGFFLFAKRIRGRLFFDCCLLLLLGAFQAYVGWYMVASGLVDRPSVSHFRLAFHLLTAIGIITYGFWVVLKLKFPARMDSKSPGKSGSEEKSTPGISRSLSTFAWITFTLLLVQFIWGAFVAGLKAGLMYNTWPMMQDKWIADSVPSSFSSMGFQAAWDSAPAVQFIHRSLGIIVLMFSLYMWFRVRKISNDVFLMQITSALGILTILQVIAGIFTLLFSVPVLPGLLHQAIGILLILSWTAFLYFSRPSPAPPGFPKANQLAKALR